MPLCSSRQRQMFIPIATTSAFQEAPTALHDWCAPMRCCLNLIAADLIFFSNIFMGFFVFLQGMKAVSAAGCPARSSNGLALPGRCSRAADQWSHAHHRTAFPFSPADKLTTGQVATRSSAGGERGTTPRSPRASKPKASQPSGVAPAPAADQPAGVEIQKGDEAPAQPARRRGRPPKLRTAQASSGGARPTDADTVAATASSADVSNAKKESRAASTADLMSAPFPLESSPSELRPPTSIAAEAPAQQEKPRRRKKARADSSSSKATNGSNNSVTENCSSSSSSSDASSGVLDVTAAASAMNADAAGSTSKSSLDASTTTISSNMQVGSQASRAKAQEQDSHPTPSSRVPSEQSCHDPPGCSSATNDSAGAASVRRKPKSASVRKAKSAQPPAADSTAAEALAAADAPQLSADAEEPHSSKQASDTSIVHSQQSRDGAAEATSMKLGSELSPADSSDGAAGASNIGPVPELPLADSSVAEPQPAAKQKRPSQSPTPPPLPTNEAVMEIFADGSSSPSDKAASSSTGRTDAASTDSAAAGKVPVPKLESASDFSGPAFSSSY